MRVAFVHDWLVTYRGGEKVLNELLPLYPDAPIYTLFYDSSAMPAGINQRTIHVPKLLNSFKIQQVHGAVQGFARHWRLAIHHTPK